MVMPWSVTRVCGGIVFVNVCPLASAGAVTWTVIVHVPGEAVLPAGTVPPVSVTVRGSAMETLPPQVVEAEPGTKLNTSPGNVSDIPTPVYAELVGFRSVIVNVDVPPAWKLAGEKLLDRPIS